MHGLLAWISTSGIHFDILAYICNTMPVAVGDSKVVPATSSSVITAHCTPTPIVDEQSSTHLAPALPGVISLALPAASLWYARVTVLAVSVSAGRHTAAPRAMVRAA